MTHFSGQIENGQRHFKVLVEECGRSKKGTRGVFKTCELYRGSLFRPKVAERGPISDITIPVHWTLGMITL